LLGLLAESVATQHETLKRMDRIEHHFDRLATTTTGKATSSTPHEELAKFFQFPIGLAPGENPLADLDAFNAKLNKEENLLDLVRII
jgi:hypothetical protein